MRAAGSARKRPKHCTATARASDFAGLSGPKSAACTVVERVGERAFPAADRVAVDDDGAFNQLGPGRRVRKRDAQVLVSDDRLVVHRYQQRGGPDRRRDVGGMVCVVGCAYQAMPSWSSRSKPLPIWSIAMRASATVRLDHAREVADRGGSVAAEVAQRELGDGLLARALVGRRGRSAVIEQRVGLLLAAPRTAAHQLLEFGVHEQVAQPGPVGLDALGAQPRGKLGSGLRPVLAQRVGDDPWLRASSAGFELEPPVRVPVERVHAGAGQTQQPADVGCGRRNARSGGAGGCGGCRRGERLLDVGVVRCRGALRQRPFGLGELLGLHRPQPGHGLLGPGEGLTDQALLAQPSTHDGEPIEGHQRHSTTAMSTDIAVG